jgi:hypothetical protein
MDNVQNCDSYIVMNVHAASEDNIRNVYDSF